MQTRPVPLLTVVVPAFNAAAYLHRALTSLKHAPTTVEVLVVNDGSTDTTAEIADSFASQFPDTYRVIHQRNRGHGGAINTGLDAARGTYFKVLDADDWFDADALGALLSLLRDMESGGVDAIFTDYVHERAGKANRTTSFRVALPVGRRFQWGDTEPFGRRQQLMMHAITFRTDILRLSGLRLPENTYYVDNLFVVIPLAHVRSMYYLPVSLYRYFIGRDDQSVNADIMVKRVDQQVRVNQIALETVRPAHPATHGPRPAELSAALVHHLEAMCAVTSATLARAGTREHLELRHTFWQGIRAENPWLYARLRRSVLGAGSNLPGAAGRRVTSLAYNVARRVVGFS